MTAPARAVFLSYASQDAEAARRICAALVAAGIEVWFDQSELRGGDAWDALIRRQIKTCYLFLPIISASTQAREEGYFRREWNLAVGRTLDMADDRAFLLPVVIDATSDTDARVPDRFREVQWTRLPEGHTPDAFVARVHALVTPDGAAGTRTPADAALQPPAAAGGTDRGVPQGAESRTLSPAPPPAPQTPVAASARPRVPLLLMLLVPAALLAIGGALLLSSWQKKEHARNELLPAIQAMAGSTFRGNGRLYDMAVEVEKAIPDDPALAKLWPYISTTLTIDTEPAGAQVYWKEYDTPTADWRLAGTTPLKEVRVARSFLRVEVRKEGYQAVEIATPGMSVRLGPTLLKLKLDPVGSLPAGMVRVPARKFEMALIGLEKYGDITVPEFLMDRLEVTNRQYKAFVDAGGYAKPEYWTVPILDAGQPLPLDRALARFTDRTGRQGPATWEAGSYPDGTEDHPVTGVSWYEAAAYAAYAGKQLPTVFHWAAVADTSRSEFIVPLSNFSGKSTVAAGSLPDMSALGIYDVAGNAREWVSNRSGETDERFIMGGGWNDPSYAFNDAYTQSALDRGVANGFRCMREVAGSVAPVALARPIVRSFRDYTKEKPVGDAVFAGIARQFLYDKGPLDAKVERTVDHELWNLEVVSIDAGYNHERLQVNVYLPKGARGPFQSVVFFPGSNGLFESTFEEGLVRRLAFVMKSGRALVWPVYKGTYERRDGMKSDVPDESSAYRDHIIAWGKELGRTIDYLETRKDMQPGKVAYLGWSWGGYVGGILPAVEKRIQAVVLNVGGMEMEKALPEADQFNYLPRITQPVLMLNGKYDMYFPVESSQKPMFNLLGTPRKDKKIVIYESGHAVPPTEFVKETLAWLDTYLGPVRQ